VYKRQALYNEPRGTDFVRSGARECRVTVTMSDGAVVTREVPPEVTQLHGMPEVLLDTDKRVTLTFGSQLEGPFLMAETGSMRARAIGRLLGVHVVDAAIRETQRDLRTIRAESGRLQRESQRLEDELAPFADLPHMEAALDRAQSLLGEAGRRQARLDRLRALQADLQRFASEAQHCRTQIDSLEGVPRASACLDALHGHLGRLSQLQAKLTRWQEFADLAAKDVEALQAVSLALTGDLAQYEIALQTLGRCPTCGQPVDPDAVSRLMGQAAGAPGAGHGH